MNYFTVKNGEEARVRFLFDKIDEMHFFWVHKFNDPYATIVCANQSDEDHNDCKWCNEGVKREAKVILPLYNEDKKQVEYWERTVLYAQNSIIPVIKEVADLNQPIASQVYKIKRSGEGMQTTYNIIPTGQSDGQVKANFGEIEDEYDSGILKTNDFDYEDYASKISNNKSNNSSNGYNNVPQATRRTTVFD